MILEISDMTEIPIFATAGNFAVFKDRGNHDTYRNFADFQDISLKSGIFGIFHKFASVGFRLLKNAIESPM